MKVQTLRTCLAEVDSATRRKLLLSLVPLSVLAIVEAASLGTILPFIDVINDPTTLRKPGSLGWLYHHSGAGSTHGFLIEFGAAIVLLFVLKGLAGLALTMWQYRLIFASEARSAADVVNRYLDLPYVVQRQLKRSTLLTLARQDVEQVHTLVVLASLNFLSETLFLLVLGVAIAVVVPVGAIEALIWIGILLALYWWLIYPRVRAVGTANIGLVGSIQHSLHRIEGGHKTIAAFNAEADTVQSFAALRSAWSPVRARLAIANQLPRYYLENGLVIAIVGVSLTTYFLQSGHKALGTVALLGAAGVRALPSLTRMLVARSQLNSGIASSDRLAQVRKDWPRISPDHGSPGVEGGEPPLGSRDTAERCIALNQVYFRYPDSDRWILRDISLEISQGEYVAFIGPSGSGKTTALDILMGLLTPERGTVEVEGVPLSPSAARAWRRNIGYVGQDVYLFDGSIADNLSVVGTPDEELCWEVLDAVGLGSFVLSLGQGLQTRVGEAGSMVSGGQRQRLGLARALYRRPSLLLLDEATASLDAQSEEAIGGLLRDLRGRLTIVAIAHRPNTISAADRVLRFEDGRIADETLRDQTVGVAS